MKMKIMLLALVAALSLGSMSFLLISKTQVPQVVLHAFNTKYPNAKKVKWEEEEAMEYEAEFKLQGQEMSANFRADGTWLETETEIKKNALPDAVKKAISKEFPGYDVEEAERIETPDLPLAFEVELENESNNSEMEAVFSADGKLLKKEMENDHDNEDEEGGQR